MKKIALICLLALAVSTANAWAPKVDEGIVILAVKNLPEDAKAKLTEYLGTSYQDDVHYLYELEAKKKAKHTKEIHYLHLDANLQPTATEGDDALKVLEQSVEVVRNRASHSKAEVTAALRTIINLMCDMHNPANVRIEGVPHSYKDFIVQYRTGDMGAKKNEISKSRWSRFWSFVPAGFTSQQWAYDIEVHSGGQAALLGKGTLRDWADEMGREAANYYAEITPDVVLTRLRRNTISQEINCEFVGRASYRLSALLNDILK